MPIEILMPALSPTMTEGNLAKWLKREGDQVRSGEVLAEIETDKATMEVEAIDDGRVGKILVPEGTQGVKVNQPIALLLAEGEDSRRSPTSPSRKLHRLRRHRRTAGNKRPAAPRLAAAGCSTARAGHPERRRWPDLCQPVGPPHGAPGRSRPAALPGRDRRAGSSNPTSKPPSRRRDRPTSRGAGPNPTDRRQSRPRRL